MVSSNEWYGFRRSFYKPLLRSLNAVVHTGLCVLGRIFARTKGCGFGARTRCAYQSQSQLRWSHFWEITDVHLKEKCDFTLCVPTEIVTNDMVVKRGLVHPTQLKSRVLNP